jgi:RecA-family ATPase
LLLPRDVDALRQTAIDIGDVGLIVLDPIASTVRGDTHAEDAVRETIEPLNPLADELGCLLIGVRHLKKDTSNGALDSILGAGAWRDVPRAVLAVAADDEDETIFHIVVVAEPQRPRRTAHVPD